MTTSVIAAVVATIGLCVTFATLIGTALFRVGHHSARLEALEVWRGNLRNDMHEISDQIRAVASEIQEVASEVHSLKTLVDERTERRVLPRPPATA